MRWTPQDDLNLVRWINEKGLKICWIEDVKQWGFYHVDKPYEINGGFHDLVDLKQHLVNLKGENKNVRIVSESSFYREMEKIGKLRKLH